MSAAQDRFTVEMRETKPELCWRVIGDGGRVCILDRDHDDGVHESLDDRTSNFGEGNSSYTVLLESRVPLCPKCGRRHA